MENSDERIRNYPAISQAHRAPHLGRLDQRGMVNGPHRVFVEKAGFCREVHGLSIRREGSDGSGEKHRSPPRRRYFRVQTDPRLTPCPMEVGLPLLFPLQPEWRNV